MRKFINLIEGADREWPEQIITDLMHWQDYADYGEVHGTERHEWQNRLMDFMREEPHHVDGLLYRATVVWDDVAEKLRGGKPALHKKAGSLLEPWSKTWIGAACYADHENQSVVFMWERASNLHVVCDLDRVPFSNHAHFEKHEVLCAAEDRLIQPEQVFALCWCDYDDDENHHYSIGPNLGHDVSYADWKEFLRQRRIM